ncbi:MAG TPA: nitrate/sulfonate/bicarbonate ABC transporter ATP-binding protein [Opitutaceae bacterium]|jgi:NitT/TauT family transport system ATP-binding protein|nr:nitrate/sulfonate/bicarbonate ABC transporter ATP-binding protein [Opitutaceae bacterium]
MDSTQTPLIELRHISHEYAATASERDLVLSEINLAVSEHEAVALLGPSGCGKSTLLRIMAGLIAPTRGEVYYKNLLLQGVSPGISMVFQNFALFPWLTVRGNVLLPVGKLPAEEQQARLETVLNTVGLGAYEYSYPRELSGGMKQRVGIARALIANPEVLAMDEPFSALDVLTAETLRGEIGRLLADPNHPLRTMVFVTHNISEAVFLATRIVVMAAQPGRVDVVVPNPLPYPRDPDSPEFRQIVEKLHCILTHTNLPDTPAADAGKVTTRVDETRRRIAPVSLPYVTPAEVLGLLALLGDEPSDVFDLSERFGKEFGYVVRVVKATELLGFVQTPEQDVLITPLGRDVVSASTADQKRLVREQLLKLKIFDLLVRLIRVQENQTLLDEDFLRELQVALPHEKPRPLFRTLLSWGRYAEIISYDQRHHLVRLYDGRRPHKAPAGGPTPPPPADTPSPPMDATPPTPSSEPVAPAAPPAN